MKEDWLGSHVTTLLVALAGPSSSNYCLNLFKKKIKPRLLANGVLQAGFFIAVCRANGCKLFLVKNKTDYKVRDVVFISSKLE